MRNPCLFACARFTYLLYHSSDPAEYCFLVDPMVEPDVLNTSESSRYRLCRSAAKCDTHCELLNIDTSPKGHRESDAISTRHQHMVFIKYRRFWKGKQCVPALFKNMWTHVKNGAVESHETQRTFQGWSVFAADTPVRGKSVRNPPKPNIWVGCGGHFGHMSSVVSPGLVRWEKSKLIVSSQKNNVANLVVTLSMFWGTSTSNMNVSNDFTKQQTYFIRIPNISRIRRVVWYKLQRTPMCDKHVPSWLLENLEGPLIISGHFCVKSPLSNIFKTLPQRRNMLFNNATDNTHMPEYGTIPTTLAHLGTPCDSPFAFLSNGWLSMEDDRSILSHTTSCKQI